SAKPDQSGTHVAHGTELRSCKIRKLLYLADRDVGIDAPDGIAKRRQRRLRLALPAYKQACVARPRSRGCRVPGVEVDDRSGGMGGAAKLRIRRHSHDLVARAPNGEELPHG